MDRVRHDRLHRHPSRRFLARRAFGEALPDRLFERPSYHTGLINVGRARSSCASSSCCASAPRLPGWSTLTDPPLFFPSIGVMSCFYSIWDIVDDTARLSLPPSWARRDADPACPSLWAHQLARKVNTSDASEFAQICGCCPSKVWGAHPSASLFPSPQRATDDALARSLARPARLPLAPQLDRLLRRRDPRRHRLLQCVCPRSNPFTRWRPSDSPACPPVALARRGRLCDAASQVRDVPRRHAVVTDDPRTPLVSSRILSLPTSRP